MKLLIMKCSPAFRHILPFSSKYSAQRLFLEQRDLIPSSFRSADGVTGDL